MPQTPLALLIGQRLGQSLDDYVVDARNKGHGWALIADNIATAADVQVSAETLRSWYADELETVVRLKSRAS